MTSEACFSTNWKYLPHTATPIRDLNMYVKTFQCSCCVVQLQVNLNSPASGIEGLEARSHAHAHYGWCRYMPSPSPLKDGAGSGFKVTPVPAGGPTAQQDHIPRQMAVHINDFGSRAGIEHTQPGEAPRRKLPKTARPSNASTRISARPASAGYRHAPS